MKDLNLFYSGGSGGFLLLHLLLLSGKYHVIFGDRVPIDMDMVIKQQWKIVNYINWKKREVWPNNEKTVCSHSELTKIYFYCNPWEKGSQIKEYSSYNIGLYTDFYSQCLMAIFKKANWFSTQHKLNDLALYSHDWTRYYDKIKTPTWPECPGVSHINSLPVEIQKEIFNNPLTESILKVALLAEIGIYQNQEVCGRVLPFLKTANAVVKLQDLVNNTAGVLKQVFDIESLNRQQMDLIKHWKNLHQPHLLTAIEISTTRS